MCACDGRLKEDGARHREAAAPQEAGGAEPEELTYRLSQRRQRKRQGRVTDAPAHMPETLSKNWVGCRSATPVVT